MEEREYWYWLAGLDRIGPVTVRRLLSFYGTPENLYKEEKWPVSDLQQAEVNESRKRIRDTLAEYHGLEKNGIRWCCPADPDYPVRLSVLPDAPAGFFYRGKLPPEGPAVGIVGARACSEYGREMAAYFGRELGSRHIPVISGMAIGIDGTAQEAALKAGGESFALLGCGVDICYPYTNRLLYGKLPENGGILSEFKPGTPPRAEHFPMRNRLISAFSDVLLVIEARERSGSLITVDQALEQGKEVLALPGRVGDSLSRGCLGLLRQGAGLLLDIDSVLEALGMEDKGSSGKETAREKPSEAKLTPEQKALLSRLDASPRHIEALLAECGQSAGELMITLLELEQSGYIRQVSGGQYVRSSFIS